MTRRSLRNLLRPGGMRARGPRRAAILGAAVVAGVTAAAVVAALVITGGSAASIPPRPTDAELRALMSDYVDRSVDARDASNPEVWDSIEFERFIAMDEGPTVLSACVQGFGITSIVFGADGSTSWTVSATGTDLTSTVYDACTLKYPYEYLKATVYTDAELDYLYNYQSTFLAPCIRAEGYEIEATPSHAEYMEQAHNDLWTWSPYNSLDFAGSPRWEGHQLDSPEMRLGQEVLQQRCPPYPEGMSPYPEEG